MIGLMNGRRPLKEIWETACVRLGEHRPTQDEVIALLAQLHRFDLLAGRGAPLPARRSGRLPHPDHAVGPPPARVGRRRPLAGGRRCGPGSHEEILSLEDPLLAGSFSGITRGMAGRWPSDRLAWLTVSQAQKQMERYHGRIRRELFRQDWQQGNLLSFSGRME